MRLSSHIAQVNLAGVVTQTGRIAELLALLMLVPVVVAILVREWSEAAIFAGVATALAAAGWAAARRRHESIGFTEGLVITAISYLVAAGAGAMPFLTLAHPVDALFEAMSGFTTTGLTVMSPSRLPTSLVFFRSYMQWIGGAGIVVLTLAVLLPTSRSRHRTGCWSWWTASTGSTNSEISCTQQTRTMDEVIAADPSVEGGHGGSGAGGLTGPSQRTRISFEMISQTAKYTLHILGYLVGERDRLVRGEEIARATGIPANYLSKILNQLRKAGIVESQKGWGGGFRLRPAAMALPIKRVLQAIEGGDRVERRDCVFGLPRCDVERPCPLHHRWDEIRTAYNAMLAETTLSDLAITESE